MTNNTELKKIVENTCEEKELVDTVLVIVEKIVALPKKKKFTIAKLIDYDPQNDIVDPLKQGTIKNLV